MAIVGDILGTGMVDSNDVATVVHRSVRSVLRWQGPSAPPGRQTEERLLELKAVLDLVARVLHDDTARVWLHNPVPTLDQRTPLEVVAAGGWREVIDVLLAFAEGVTA